jgi:hypothetical protein
LSVFRSQATPKAMTSTAIATMLFDSFIMSSMWYTA